MSERPTLQRIMENQIFNWGALIKDLKNRAKSADIETRIEYYDRIIELQFKMEGMKRRLQELGYGRQQHFNMV